MALTIELHSLFNGFIGIPLDLNREVTALVIDSRQAQPGCLFIAIQGHSLDGRRFIDDAKQKGAKAILTEGQKGVYFDGEVVMLSYPSIKDVLGTLASRFYQTDKALPTLVGITGTNGKTSIAYMLARALESGYIGTLGLGHVNDLTPCANTTPSPLLLHRTFHELAANGVRQCMMEVSSHAIEQKRIQGLVFNTAVFTNLTHEHVDYHGSMENYGECKLSLFASHGLKHAVVNMDDEWGRKLLNRLNDIKVLSYAIANDRADIYAKTYHFSIEGIEAVIHTPFGEVSIKSPLLGNFNLSNLLAVLAVLLSLDIPLAEAAGKIAMLTGVVGRMQVVRRHPTCVVDYAHTPDALLKALECLKPLCRGRLRVVFGCGGNRDVEKRAKMGEIASRYADDIIITNDNPRDEEPAEIAKQISEGIHNHDAVSIELNRKKAIEMGLRQSAKDDLLLIAGKGHENYQIIGDKRYDFSDVDVVKDLVW